MKEHVPRDAFLQDLYLCYFGEEECEPGHAWGPAVKDHYKIHLIFEGHGHFESAGKDWCLHGGQVFLILPHTISFYAADEADPWHYGWLGFNGLTAMRLLERAGLSESSPVIDCDRVTELHSLILAMAAVDRANVSRPVALAGLLYRCMALLMESRESIHPKAHIPSECRRDFYIRSVQEYIENNYSTSLSVGAIAEYIGLQRSYLSGLFSKEIGCSIQEYLIRHRVRVATGLMENGLLSIGDIARSVGYQDSLLFSKTFHRIMGLSPSEYRSRRGGKGAMPTPDPENLRF
jgi:AraC-like DNA-binding protein